MKKIFTLATFFLSALSAAAADYTCSLKVFVNEVASAPQEITVSVNQQEDGKYTMSLKNFKLGNSLNVGNITVNNVDTAACGSTTCLTTQQTIKIAAGDDESTTWMGPSLGDVPIIMKGELNGNTFNAILSIFMASTDSPMDVRVELGDVTSMGQIPNSDFEAFHTEDNGKKTTSAFYKSEEQPNHWHSFFNASGKYKDTVKATHTYKSTDIREGATGTYCAEVKSTTVLSFSANGTITTGRLNAGSLTATSTDNNTFLDLSNTDMDANGDPYYTILNNYPDSLQVWMKFKVGERSESNKANDKATISAAITDGTYYQDPTNKDYTNVVATASNAAIVSNNEAWQLVKIPFNYTENTVTPKAILVTMSTCSVASGGSTNSNDPDIIWVDDLSLTYSAEAKSIKFKGTELEFEDGIAETESTGAVNVEDFEVETTSKYAYVSKTLIPDSEGVYCQIHVASNDLKSANTYICYVAGATTAIKNVQTVTAPSGIKAIYNLNGQRVSSMNGKGVFIVEKNDGTTTKVLNK